MQNLLQYSKEAADGELPLKVVDHRKPLAIVVSWLGGPRLQWELLEL